MCICTCVDWCIYKNKINVYERHMTSNAVTCFVEAQKLLAQDCVGLAKILSAMSLFCHH